MNLRRTLATVAASVALVSVLGACGFNYPTDKINNITAGVSDRSGTVNVLNAAIVSKADNSGTFVATLVNNDQDNPVNLTSIAGNNFYIGQEDQHPTSIPTNGLVDLSSQGGIPMNGDFQAGDFVPMTFTFDNGQSATFSVPVVADDGQWSGLDTSTPSSIPTPSDFGSATASPAAG